jgi:hypothetical protein
MRYFYTEVEDDRTGQVERLAEQLGKELKSIGGLVSVGRSDKRHPSVLLIALPDDINPDELLPPGISFKEGHAVEVPAFPDNGIEE